MCVHIYTWPIYLRLYVHTSPTYVCRMKFHDLNLECGFCFMVNKLWGLCMAKNCLVDNLPSHCEVCEIRDVSFSLIIAWYWQFLGMIPEILPQQCNFGRCDRGDAHIMCMCPRRYDNKYVARTQSHSLTTQPIWQEYRCLTSCFSSHWPISELIHVAHLFSNQNSSWKGNTKI